MKNSKQNIFSLEDLRKLGFEREDAGGFFYYIKYLDNSDRVNCEALVTPDYDSNEEEADQRYTINRAQEPLSFDMTRLEIEKHIEEYGS